MKVKVIEKSNKYFAIFSCPSSNIPDKIIIKKSWDSSFSKEVILNYNIFDEEINILEKDIDLLNFEFELDKLNNFYEYKEFIQDYDVYNDKLTSIILLEKDVIELNKKYID